MTETILLWGLRAMWLLLALLVAPLALCWIVFAVAWVRGELTDESTPAQLLDRWFSAKEQP